MDSEHHESPHDALIKSLEKVEDMENVLVIYEGKDGHPAGSFDSDLSAEKCIWLMELYKHWLLTHSIVDKSES